MIAMTPDFDASVTAVLGKHLRSLRRSHGLTRAQVCAAVPTDLSVSTLASYEAGDRRATVSRLFELCTALQATPGNVLAKVSQELTGGPGPTRVCLRDFTRTRGHQLRPLRAWAAVRLADTPSGTDHVIELTENVLARAAELCGLAPERLLDQLRHEEVL